jgi:hypothetical protein
MLFYTGVKESHILREEDGLEVSENRVLRRIFGKKKGGRHRSLEQNV